MWYHQYHLSSINESLSKKKASRKEVSFMIDGSRYSLEPLTDSDSSESIDTSVLEVPEKERARASRKRRYSCRADPYEYYLF